MDSAAAVKLIYPEPESKALREWLGERVKRKMLSSTLIEVETHRTIRRAAPERLTMIAPCLANIIRIEMDVTVRGVAAQIGDRHLGSLDAIHLATAMQLGAVIEHFVTYDKRLLAAATAMGMPVACPGASLN